jgi:hypothetical protein
MTSGGESERLFEAWRRQARGGTPLGNVTGHHLPQDKRLRHRVTPLSFSAPKALANNHHRDAPCPSSFAPTPPGSQRWMWCWLRNPLRQPGERLTASRFAPCRRLDKQAARSRPTKRNALANTPPVDSFSPHCSCCSKYSANHPGESVRRVMTTHPTSVNDCSADGERTVSAADHVPDLRSAPHKRVTGRVGGGRAGCVDHAERHHHKLEKTI